MKQTALALLAFSLFAVGCAANSTPDPTDRPPPSDETTEEKTATNDDPTRVKVVIDEDMLGTSNGTDKGSSGQMH